MKKTTLLFAILATVALAAAGCKKEDKSSDAPAKPTATKTADTAPEKAPTKTAPTAKPAEVDVANLDELIGASKVAVFDANGASTREKHGKIPTAKLLSHYKNYELSELPEDKASKLVFYCSNTACQAAPTAADKALAAGYTDVNVLPVGVMGWVEAGKKTDKI